MSAQDFLGRFGVPRHHGFEDGAMLADQQIDGRDLGQAEKTDTIELGLLALDDRPYIAVADRIGKGAVKFVIRVRKAVRIVAGLSLFGDRTFGFLERYLW